MYSSICMRYIARQQLLELRDISSIELAFFFAQWKLSLKEGQKTTYFLFLLLFQYVKNKVLSRFKYFLKISYYVCKRHIPFFFFFFFFCFSRKSLKKSFSFVFVLLSFIYIYFNLVINSFIIFNDLDCDLLTTLYSRTSFTVFLLRTQAKNGLSFYHSLHIQNAKQPFLLRIIFLKTLIIFLSLERKI